jgi:sensor histidine kinase regulating citrate/malate metabolism
MADGSALSFMPSLDIISLFSNALDNAFEAVTTLPKEEREIHMTVKETMGILSICVENPYEARIEMVDGIPATTKSDRRFHGFGMRSIRSTVEKYGGTMDIRIDEDIFTLTIALPAKKKD